uniref:Putative molecular chaperone prefoldin subunit 2 n=1 Tax=Xenopsylla cheopis TaxID=163159 RepID=A0A6M2DP94_XENCH
MESSTVPPSTSQDNLKKSESSITSEKKSEEIIANFQRLRSEQRGLASKLNTLEIDLNEHKVVIDQLKTVDPDRKCFRMIGGILTERTVKEVLPILISNTEQLGKVIEAYNKNLIEKGKLINQYKELHNIKVRGQDDVMPEEDKTETPRNVLVANN